LRSQEDDGWEPITAGNLRNEEKKRKVKEKEAVKRRMCNLISRTELN
jgi:hypothetical protein